MQISKLNILFLLFFISILPCTLWAQAVPNRMIVVVDGYSSGSLFAPAIRHFDQQDQQTTLIVHVHSRGKPLPCFQSTFYPRNFDFDLVGNVPLAALANNVSRIAHNRDIRKVFVVAGAESGVMLADQLGQALNPIFGTPYNIPNPAKRDKYMLAQALKKAGIAHVRQIRTRDIAEAAAWIEVQKLFESATKQVVVKPASSAGSEKVFFCSTLDEVQSAFQAILGQVNTYGILDTDLLVQECILGQEYAFNTATLKIDGKRHTVAESLFAYQKRPAGNGQYIYWADRLLPLAGPLYERLSDYHARLLEALGHDVGLTHVEIFDTPDRGPVVGDFNARAMGSMGPMLVPMWPITTRLS